MQVGWTEGRRALLGVWEVGHELKQGEVVFRRLYTHGDAMLQPFTRR
jgi:hypothetical protein